MYLLLVIVAYFALLLGVAFRASRHSTEESFYTGGKKSKWYLVAFGMIGTSLSGVTFISVPGDVKTQSFYYFAVVLGYFLGYLVIIGVLLPLYYKLHLTSIYEYLQKRFGFSSNRIGALFFILSRTLGATLRLYLVIEVLYAFVLQQLGISFWVFTCLFIAIILLYTVRSGVKALVWTDTIQTFFMLTGLIASVIFILSALHLNLGSAWTLLEQKNYTQIFNTDYHASTFWLKQVLGGMLVTITMTGLDQEMMQKNISIPKLSHAQRSMFVFASLLIIVNLLFLLLGGLLSVYAESLGVDVVRDKLFPTMATYYFHPILSSIFILALISAVLPSADGALTALTSSFCIDILDIRKQERWNEKKRQQIRQWVQIVFALLFILFIFIFKIFNNGSVINTLLSIANYTYGPLLGLFAFGLMMKQHIVRDKLVPFICIASPFLCLALKYSVQPYFFPSYALGLELLFINGLLTFIGLWSISQKAKI